MSEWYGSRSGAGLYFQKSISKRTLWNKKDNITQEAALFEATQHIDRLNFYGIKHAAWLVEEAGGDEAAVLTASTTQLLQFPRGSDTVVPKQIEYACYEEAYILLAGHDPQHEDETLAVRTEGFTGVRTTYNPEVIQLHKQVGIISILAWRYLLPFVEMDQTITLSRG